MTKVHDASAFEPTEPGVAALKELGPSARALVDQGKKLIVNSPAPVLRDDTVSWYLDVGGWFNTYYVKLREDLLVRP